MKKSVIVAIICLFVLGMSFRGQAQRREKDLLLKGEIALAEEKYKTALPYYLQLYGIDSTDVKYNFSLGLCYLNSLADKYKSIPHFEHVAKNKAEFHRVHYYLGKAYHFTHRFEEAIRSFKIYKGQIHNDRNPPISPEELDRLIKMCNIGIFMTSNPLNNSIIAMPNQINTKYGDYVPVISADESIMIFTARRKGSTGYRIDDDENYYEDIYSSENIDGEWSPSKKVITVKDDIVVRKKNIFRTDYSTVINTEIHDAAIALSADGQKLFIYKSDGRRWGDIYVCERRGKNWSSPRKLGANVNTKYWDGHASISADENTLYLSSNRPGGIGGRDIYKLEKLPNGTWGEAVNLGRLVNTQYDDDAPFIHPDGKTLFFSSKGHSSMGGYDIFRSVFENGNWNGATNLGYPVNTADDDIYFVLAANGKTGYFSSARFSSTGHQDIYKVNMPLNYDDMPVLTLLKGIITAGDKAVEAKVIVTDNETNRIIGIYRSNSVTGKYMVIIPASKDYSITFEAEGLLFHSQNVHFTDQDTFIQIINNIELCDDEYQEKIVLNNIFFEDATAVLKSESKNELRKLYSLLEDNPSLIVELSSSIKMISTEFDKKLAEQRAKAVLKYLIQRGILANRLTSSGFSSDEEGVLVETLELHLIGGFMEDTYSPCMQDELVVREYTTMKIDTITEDHYSYTDSLTKDFVVSVDTIMFEDTMVILERILRIDTLFQLVDKSKLTDDQILDLIIDEKADFKLADNLEDFSLQIEEMRKEEFSDMKDLIGQVFLLPDIYFDFDRDILRAKSKKILQKLYLFLDENPELLVEISGHTDSKGNDNYNLTLSQKRSKVVVKYLIQRGIHQRRLVAKGYGETNPLALNMNPDGTDNEKGRQLNRRTELRIIGINKSKIYSDVLIDFSDLTYVDNLITDYSVNTISNLVFRVQIGVFTQPADHVDFSFLKIRKIQREPLGNGTIRFTAGALSTLEAAESLRKEIIEAGVIDAYIVAYYKGRLIKIDELDKLLSE